MKSANLSYAIVLGAFGFVGRHVCRELHRRGYQVSGLGHGTWADGELVNWGLTDWTADDIDVRSLTMAAAGRKVDLIIHCAGGSAVSASYLAPYSDYQRTVASTAAALEFARTSASRPRVVLTSSAAVYGDQGEVDLSESSVKVPVSPYGFHKLAAEEVAQSYARFFDCRVSIVRLFSVYGEGLRKQLLWDASNKFLAGFPEFLGTGEERRDWIHVDDAAQLLCDAATHRVEGLEVFNGANRQATTREVLATLANMLGSSAPPVFTGQAHAGNPRRLTADATLAQRELGWKPAVDLQSGLRRYADWIARTAETRE